MPQKRILCFGDSNTWGYIPQTKAERFSEKERFPKLLQRLLGRKFEIIEEGLNSRTLISEDTRPNKEGRNGSVYLIPCLDSHDPLDLVILMLGTNELKERFQKSPEEIGSLLEKYFVRIILHRRLQCRARYPKLLIVSPPIVHEENKYSSAIYQGATVKSKHLSTIYSKIAKRNRCDFLDGSILDVGADGIHLTQNGHKQLAEMLAQKLKTMRY
ncbi:SGNH/GDSL hydrolase family protein [Candidatus Woesearchaeota archaeon]|nr:SGNH/GDSL hydrolase family protein [Candidatus Woesearchaeota archaeon]